VYKRQTRKKRHDWWAALPDDKLLDLRFKDLHLRLTDTWVEDCVHRLYEELDARGLAMHPHVWISSEWFSPDHVPGIAIPFYLVHPRLMRLEEKQMLEVEGGTWSSCMRILRHEAGHCYDTAYRLHRKKRWREVFGAWSMPYPDSYAPRPASRKFVLHLEGWYAQAHPAEDFAETFAIWLAPSSRWKSHYRDWPALRKLELVDELMGHIAGKPPVVRSRAHIEPLNELNTTLRQHYKRKRLHYMEEWPEFFDDDLLYLFTADLRARSTTAASFLRTVRQDVRQTVSHWTGTHPYTIDQVLGDMIDRCRELGLRLRYSPRYTRTQVMIMVTVQTMNYIQGGHLRVAL
jgi:hypothetical protein